MNITALQTPWGPAQSVTEIAEGVKSVSTSSHGGYWLSSKRHAEVRRQYPQFNTFHNNGNWYEEDCDWCMVYLTFPELGTDEQIFNAVRTADNWKRNDVGQYIPLAIRERAERYAASVDDKWEVGACMSGDDYSNVSWKVQLRRKCDSAEKIITMPYPRQQFFTDAELTELTA